MLHYIGANDIEHFRQKTAPNAVAICKLLLDMGSAVDALAGSYGGGPAQTTLALLASSDHPSAAGLTGELVRLLARAGARVDVNSVAFIFEVETAGCALLAGYDPTSAGRP